MKFYFIGNIPIIVFYYYIHIFFVGFPYHGLPMLTQFLHSHDRWFHSQNIKKSCNLLNKRSKKNEIINGEEL